ncbi:MAG: hypothetical protein WDO14_06910 [Bacteroidota bacterium]
MMLFGEARDNFYAIKYNVSIWIIATIVTAIMAWFANPDKQMLFTSFKNFLSFEV